MDYNTRINKMTDNEFIHYYDKICNYTNAIYGKKLELLLSKLLNFYNINNIGELENNTWIYYIYYNIKYSINERAPKKLKDLKEYCSNRLKDYNTEYTLSKSLTTIPTNIKRKLQIDSIYYHREETKQFIKYLKKTFEKELVIASL